MALGRADWELRVDATTLVLRVIGFVIGLRWGIVGVAVGYTIADAVMHPVAIMVVGRLVPLTVGQYARALVPAIGATLAMAASWWVVNESTSAFLAGMPLALLRSATGAFVYLALIRWLAPEEMSLVLRTAVQRRAVAPTRVVSR